MSDLPQANSSISHLPQANSSISDLPQANSSISDLPQANSSISDLRQANSSSQNSHINVNFTNVDSVKNMMIKLKKIDQLKAKTQRKVMVLLVAYNSVTVIQNETLNCRTMLFRRAQR